MQNIKLGKALEDETTNINDVEKILGKHSIMLRTSETEFRNMSDVLDEVAKKWGSLGETEQQEIAVALSGLHQRENFLTLMENYDQVLKAETMQTEAAGLAQKRYQEYLRGAEAAQNRMTTAWEEFWQKGMSSGVISKFYDFLAGVIKLTTLLGGLRTIVILLTTGLIAYISVTFSATAAMEALTLAFTTNPVTIWVVAIGAAISAIMILVDLIPTLEKRLDSVNQKFTRLQSSFDEAKSNADRMGELSKRFEELRNNTKKTDEEEKEFLRIQKEIKDILPTVAGTYDDMGNFKIADTIATRDLNKATEELLKLKMKELELASFEKIELETEALKNQEIWINLLTDSYNNLLIPIRELFDNIMRTFPMVEKLLSRIKAGVDLMSGINPDPFNIGDKVSGGFSIEEQKSIAEEMSATITETFYSMTSEQMKKDYLNALRGMGESWATQLADELEKGMTSEVEPVLVSGSEKAGKSGADALTKEYLELVDTIVDMIKQKKKAEKDALKDELDGIKDSVDAEKEKYKLIYEETKRISDEKKKALQREYEDLKRIFDAQKDAIDAQLKAQKAIIDRERELLDLKKEEEEYNRTKEDNQEKLSQIEAQIAQLSLDNSAEAIARRQALEQEAANLREEMSENEVDRELELKNNVLDEEERLAEERAARLLTELEERQNTAELEHEMMLRRLEDEEYLAQRQYELTVQNLEAEFDARKAALEEQISQIDEYLSQEGTMRRDAMEMIKNDNGTLMQSLIDWNRLYGDGLDETIIKMWDAAIMKVKEFAAEVSKVPTPPIFGHSEGEMIPDPFSGVRGEIGEHHEGVNSGFVGGKAKLKSNEKFAKLLDEELLVTPSQMDSFMNKLLPSMFSNASTSPLNNGSTNVEKLFDINVAGNLDKSVLPDIERIADRAIEKLNDVMKQRGYKRNVNQYAS